MITLAISRFFKKINFTNSIGWNQIRCTKINNTTYQWSFHVGNENWMCLVILEILNNFQISQMLNWCTFLYFILRFLHREGDTQLFFRKLAIATLTNNKKIGWKVTTLSSKSCRPSLIPADDRHGGHEESLIWRSRPCFYEDSAVTQDVATQREIVALFLFCIM